MASIPGMIACSPSKPKKDESNDDELNKPITLEEAATFLSRPVPIKMDELRAQVQAEYDATAVTGDTSKASTFQPSMPWYNTPFDEDSDEDSDGGCFAPPPVEKVMNDLQRKQLKTYAYAVAINERTKGMEKSQASYHKEAMESQASNHKKAMEGQGLLMSEMRSLRKEMRDHKEKMMEQSDTGKLEKERLGRIKEKAGRIKAEKGKRKVEDALAKALQSQARMKIKPKAILAEATNGIAPPGKREKVAEKDHCARFTEDAQAKAKEAKDKRAFH